MVQWNGVVFDCDELPVWLKAAIDIGAIERGQDGDLLVKTPEGTMTCQPTAWIAHGLQGEIYPVQDMMLGQTYTRVPDPRTAPPGG